MIESELFGHRKGAFTGGNYDKPGLFEAADSGTLYLNEIADSKPEFQAKLLEVIESKAVRRLGCTECKKINVRIIAATNQDLKQFMISGKFRVDLYHRLNEIPITLPPLADRPEDIPDLIKHFLTGFGLDISADGHKSKLSDLADLLSARDWTGNVRELESELKRLSTLYNNDLGAMIDSLKKTLLTDIEKLRCTLEETGWNQRETARRLGVNEATIRYRIKKFQLSQKAPA